jgi:CarD family transcriptional regulator
VVAKPAAKAAQAAVAKKAAAPAKPAPPDKAAAKPAAKTAPVVSKPAAAKPPAGKSAPAKPEAARPVAGQTPPPAAAKAPPARTPAAPLQTAQQKPPPPAAAAPARAAAAPEATAPAPVSQAPSPDRRPMMPDRPPARPMAKAEIFVEGDHVVYPTHGVGKVERIATEEIAGHKLELIHITFEENRMTLRVPVAKARTAGLRKLATRKLFDEALAVLKGRARIKRTMWSRRAQEYEAKINSGDPLAIAEVVRDLHRNAGQPDQSFSERQIYEAAMDRLAAELAALDKTDKMTAATKLANFLKTV